MQDKHLTVITSRDTISDLTNLRRPLDELPPDHNIQLNDKLPTTNLKCLFLHSYIMHLLWSRGDDQSRDAVMWSKENDRYWFFIWKRSKRIVVAEFCKKMEVNNYYSR